MALALSARRSTEHSGIVRHSWAVEGLSGSGHAPTATVCESSGVPFSAEFQRVPLTVLAEVAGLVALALGHGDQLDLFGGAA